MIKKLDRTRAGTSPVRAFIWVAALILLAARPAAAQSASTDTVLATAAAAARASSGDLWSSHPLVGDDSTGYRQQSIPLLRSLHPTPRDSSWRRRVRTYTLVGMVVGGLLGYAAHEEVFWNRDEEACNLGDVSYCPYTPYIYVVAGASVGVTVGTLVGLVRERP